MKASWQPGAGKAFNTSGALYTCRTNKQRLPTKSVTGIFSAVILAFALPIPGRGERGDFYRNGNCSACIPLHLRGGGGCATYTNNRPDNTPPPLRMPTVTPLSRVPFRGLPRDGMLNVEVKFGVRYSTFIIRHYFNLS